MAEANPNLTMDSRTILEGHTIEGNWTMELIARTPKVYEEGDLLFGFSGGGPGYGDPLERDPLEILEDVKKKIISDGTAQNVYRIAYDPVRRKPFDEFQKQWSKLSPPKEILQYYGTWPDAKSTGPCFRP
jgi:acetophenone carboxylase